MLTVHVWPWWRGAMVSGCFEPVHDPAQHEQTAHDAAHAGATSTLAPLPLMMSTLVRPPLPRLVTLMAYRCDVGMPPWHHTILHQRARAPPLNTCERGWVAPSRRSTAARGCAGRRGWAAGPQCPRARASTRCPTGCATTAIGCAHTVPPGQPPVHRAVQAGALVHCTLCTQCTCTCTRTAVQAGDVTDHLVSALRSVADILVHVTNKRLASLSVLQAHSYNALSPSRGPRGRVVAIGCTIAGPSPRGGPPVEHHRGDDSPSDAGTMPMLESPLARHCRLL